jgi:predicted secreted protein
MPGYSRRLTLVRCFAVAITPAAYHSLVFFTIDAGGYPILTKTFRVILYNSNHKIIMSVRGERHARTVRPGEKFTIELQSNPSTGYRWHLLYFDKSILNLISSELATKPTNQIGTAGIERFNFEATKKGTTSIKLIYKRSWESGTVKSNEFFVNVI